MILICFEALKSIDDLLLDISIFRPHSDSPGLNLTKNQEEFMEPLLILLRVPTYLLKKGDCDLVVLFYMHLVLCFRNNIVVAYGIFLEFENFLTWIFVHLFCK